MALTLAVNPVGTASSKLFAGFQKCEVVFYRKDINILACESGGGGILITHVGDLTSLITAGDTIYLYSQGVNYTYNGSYVVASVLAGEIVVIGDYIEDSDLGYINYKKNYYVELQCVNPILPEVNILPFSLMSDGDAAGNISFDVSIVNELNVQRGAIAHGAILTSRKEFQIKYREVYQGSSDAFTLVDGKKFIMLYSIDEPERDVVLNNLDEPCLFLGYPAGLAMAIKERPASSTIELTYEEKDINKYEITPGTLGLIASDVNGFLMWMWPNTRTVNQQTKYIDFTIKDQSLFDFAAPDFAYPDFLTE